MIKLDTLIDLESTINKMAHDITRGLRDKAKEEVQQNYGKIKITPDSLTDDEFVIHCKNKNIIAVEPTSIANSLVTEDNESSYRVYCPAVHVPQASLYEIFGPIHPWNSTKLNINTGWIENK